MNQLLQIELTLFLNSERYDPVGYNSANSSNGNYTRTVIAKYCEVCLTIPRDRNGEFHKRSLSKRYLTVYGDSTYLNVRRSSVSKEALYILIGITAEGYKKVLDYRIYPQESTSNYHEMLKDIQMRVCEEVL